MLLNSARSAQCTKYTKLNRVWEFLRLQCPFSANWYRNPSLNDGQNCHKAPKGWHTIHTTINAWRTSTAKQTKKTHSSSGNLTERCEEVISKKGKSRSIGQDDQTEVRMGNDDIVSVGRSNGLSCNDKKKKKKKERKKEQQQRGGYWWRNKTQSERNSHWENRYFTSGVGPQDQWCTHRKPFQNCSTHLQVVFLYEIQMKTRSVPPAPSGFFFSAATTATKQQQNNKNNNKRPVNEKSLKNDSPRHLDGFLTTESTHPLWLVVRHRGSSLHFPPTLWEYTSHEWELCLLHPQPIHDQALELAPEKRRQRAGIRTETCTKPTCTTTTTTTTTTTQGRRTRSGRSGPDPTNFSLFFLFLFFVFVFRG